MGAPTHEPAPGAKHVGITVKEFKSRLGKGDVELLSAILATPLGAYAFQQMRGDTAGPST